MIAISELQNLLDAVIMCPYDEVGVCACGYRTKSHPSLRTLYRQAITTAMQFDCADLGRQLHNHTKARQLFRKWVKTGNCPYGGVGVKGRALVFDQCPNYYKHRMKPLTRRECHQIFTQLLAKRRKLINKLHKERTRYNGYNDC